VAALVGADAQQPSLGLEALAEAFGQCRPWVDRIHAHAARPVSHGRPALTSISGIGGATGQVGRAGHLAARAHHIDDAALAAARPGA
jgi:hypothetical protein